MTKIPNSEESSVNIELPCRIISMGKYLPNKVLSSSIEAAHGLPQGWALKYSGVEARHQVTHENVAFMGAKAAESALEKANLSIDDIDVVISANTSFDQILPSQSSLLLHLLQGGDNSRCTAFDINATCLSFVAAFNLAAEMLQQSNRKHILIVSSEVSSKNLDPSDWETLTLFGDGAAAAVIGKSLHHESGIIKYKHDTFSEGHDKAKLLGGGISYPLKDYPWDVKLHSFKMDGQELLRLSLQYVPPFMKEFFSTLSLNWSEVDVVIPHQASKTGLNLLKKIAKLDPDKVERTLESYGNCIAASIPLTFNDAFEKGKVLEGQTCFLCGTSAGFAVGALLYKHGS
jgi:3-oxoacyl-[acyl-carrier-protein] synthase-3